MRNEQVKELLLQALETEMGGVKIYKMAVKCAVNADLKKEWKEYLEQTEHHEEIVRTVFAELELDPEEITPGRKIVKHIGDSLVEAMEMALKAGDPAAAQIVASECVVLAETKDHQNWSLIGQVSKKAKGAMEKALRAAYDEVENEEDEHLYHTAGWSRELWIEALGMPAVLPPPEEEKHVKTAIGAARAKAGREEMI